MRHFTYHDTEGNVFNYAGFDRAWYNAKLIVVVREEDSTDVWALDNEHEALDAWLAYQSNYGFTPYFQWRLFTIPQGRFRRSTLDTVIITTGLLAATALLVGLALQQWGFF